MGLLFSLKNKEQVLLRADALNYELCRLRSRKDDETGIVGTEWEAFKWFPSLYQALNKIVDMKMRTSDARSLKELAAELEEARKEITDVWTTTALYGERMP